MMGAIEREVLELHPAIGCCDGFGALVPAAPLLHEAPGGPAWDRWQADWSLEVGTSLSPRSSWEWSGRWGLPVHTPWISTSEVLDGFGLVEEEADGFGVIPAAVAGVVAAIAAGASAATGAAGAVNAIIKAIRENESEEIKQARAEGAGPPEIQAIRRKYRKQKQAARRKARKDRQRARKLKARGKSKIRKASKSEARRKKKMPSKAQVPPEEVARQIAAGLATAADIAHRTGMGIQEVSAGAAVDPWSGRRVVHAVTPQAAPLSPGDALALARAAGVPGPMAWLRAPLVAGIPAWGVLAGGAVLVIGAGLFLRGRR